MSRKSKIIFTVIILLIILLNVLISYDFYSLCYFKYNRMHELNLPCCNMQLLLTIIPILFGLLFYVIALVISKKGKWPYVFMSISVLLFIISHFSHILIRCGITS